MKIMKKTKKLILFCIAVLAVGAAVFFLGRAVFPARADAFGFALIALCAVLILCAVFEGSRLSVLRISLISCMILQTSLCSATAFLMEASEMSTPRFSCIALRSLTSSCLCMCL